MPWDYFCYYCGGALEGSMSDGEDLYREMQVFESSMKGKIVKCGSCEKIYDFDTDQLLDEAEVKKSGKEIIELYA